MRLKKHIFLFVLAGIFAFGFLQAQVENIIVEKYYISDSNDAGDRDGGALEEGSVTYRIYVDLAEGNKLMSVFGNANHPLKIESTAKFFNNEFSGTSVGYQISLNSLKRNTVALDTWLTMGFASKVHFGILKSEDPDTSIIGGINNDGGSLKVPGGLLINTPPPPDNIKITEKDGLVKTLLNPIEFNPYQGFEDTNGEDNTIFNKTDNSGLLLDYSIKLSHKNGITGSTPGNKILIAQLTTKGEISFELNLEVKNIDNSIINYVAKEPFDDKNVYSNFLSYPPKCGCTDPDYLEFSQEFTCGDDTSCKTPIVFGCTDPASCNYNPLANKTLPGLCCYDSKCALDLGVVCPETVFGCTDINSFNYNPTATVSSDLDTCCYVAGCMSKSYLEYDSLACFDDGSFCKVLIITGCMDRSACNYNPIANTPLNSTCLYENCDTKSAKTPNENGSADNMFSGTEFSIFPNPANSSLSLRVLFKDYTKASSEIYDVFGRLIYQNIYESEAGLHEENIDLSVIPKGIFIFKCSVNGRVSTKLFTKSNLN